MKVRRQVRSSIKTCDGLSGPILGILDKLNPAVDIVVSGHTHQSYICDYATKIQLNHSYLLQLDNMARLLLTSRLN